MNAYKMTTLATFIATGIAGAASAQGSMTAPANGGMAQGSAMASKNSMGMKKPAAKKPTAMKQDGMKAGATKSDSMKAPSP